MTAVIRDDIPLGYTYDQHGSVLTFKDKDGYWQERTYDQHGNELTRKSIDGYLLEYTRDQHGNELTVTKRGKLRICLSNAGSYTLRYSPDTELYDVGCRYFTAEQALAHWGNPRADNRARAKQFVEAIKLNESKNSEEN